MKLTSLKIYETLTYSEVKNLPNLTKAMNRHIDIRATVDDVRNMARDGVDGLVGDIMAFELGLAVDGFVPVYGQKKKPKKKTQPVTYIKRLPRCITQSYNGKYKVTISHKRKNTGFGTFNTIDEAVAARDAAAKMLGKKIKEVSKYKGVRRHGRRGYIYGEIHINGETEYLGKFKTEEAAALAYNKIAMKHGRPINRVAV